MNELLQFRLSPLTHGEIEVVYQCFKLIDMDALGANKANILLASSGSCAVLQGHANYIDSGDQALWKGQCREELILYEPILQN
jgi:hypothetical protein